VQLSDLITEVRRNIGRTDVNDTTTEDMIKTAINRILTEYLPLEGLRPYKNNTTVSTTADTEYIDLSSLTGFIGVVKDGVTVEDGDDWTTLYPMAQEEYNDSGTGKPQYFEIRFVSNSPYIYFRPIPDDAYNVKIWYYAKETELSDDTDEAILSQVYGDGPIIAGATMLVAKQLGIERLIAIWEREFYRFEVPKLLDWQHEQLEGDYKLLEHPYL